MNSLKKSLFTLVILSSLTVIPYTANSSPVEVPRIQEKGSDEIAYRRGGRSGYRGRGAYYGGRRGYYRGGWYAPRYSYRYSSPNYYRSYYYPGYKQRYSPYYYRGGGGYYRGGSGVSLYLGW